MKYLGSTLVLAVSLALSACNPAATTAVPPADAGNIPPSAYAECDPAGPHDAATFTFTATCSPPVSDGGGSNTCAEWAEGADGDWSPFVESCFAEGGTIGSVHCPEAGLSGACTLPASCTTQTSVFYYDGAESGASAQATCVASGGSFAP